ncbi:DUF4416 family protein [Desulfonema magnum]|uniref:DUF4416 n=1 Tax=Desulfonema magnum TaxID=45655 RepID=A0A975BUG8_9BACT|nr:DUF4416 family protein [Desulfonema magnum]QTA91503.1 DUF4416 [Desulfonema magnum]
MSIPQSPKPAKLVIGLFMKEKSLLSSVTDELTRQFGLVDMVSSWIPFNYTTYYESETGTPLFRRVLTFNKLIKQSFLADIKHKTNAIELKYSKNNNRRVNIDPGYMLHERFVLATGKNFTHRIYIGKGIYADLTLIYTKGSFQKLPWTYPDYADKNMLTYLGRVRDRYIKDLKPQFPVKTSDV